MKLLLISSACLLGFCLASTLREGFTFSEGDIEPFGIGGSCDFIAGSSGVICVTKTKFVLGYQNPYTDTPMSCPAGTVCNDNLDEICSPTADPTCYNDVVGVKGVCNQCYTTPGLGNSPVCVNKTHFSFCANGKLQVGMTYACNAPTPNCKATLDGNNAVTNICTAQTTGLDCP